MVRCIHQVGSVKAYLDKYIYSNNDFYDYLEKIGGVRTLHQLEKIENKLADYPKVAKKERIIMVTDTEKMIITSSRLLPKDAGIYVGTGMPLLASVLAQNTHAPDLLLVFEGGGVGGKPTGRLPIQVSESLTYENGVIVGSMDYVMSLAQAGWIEYGFLSVTN